MRDTEIGKQDYGDLERKKNVEKGRKEGIKRKRKYDIELKVKTKLKKEGKMVEERYKR